MKESMGKAGCEQGNMSPHVTDFQKPMSDFAESGFSKTLEYIERKDAHEKASASKVKSQHYNGRYS